MLNLIFLFFLIKTILNQYHFTTYLQITPLITSPILDVNINVSRPTKDFTFQRYDDTINDIISVPFFIESVLRWNNDTEGSTSVWFRLFNVTENEDVNVTLLFQNYFYLDDTMRDERTINGEFIFPYLGVEASSERGSGPAHPFGGRRSLGNEGCPEGYRFIKEMRDRYVREDNRLPPFTRGGKSSHSHVIDGVLGYDTNDLTIMVKENDGPTGIFFVILWNHTHQCNFTTPETSNILGKEILIPFCGTGMDDRLGLPAHSVLFFDNDLYSNDNILGELYVREVLLKDGREDIRILWETYKKFSNI